MPGLLVYKSDEELAKEEREQARREAELRQNTPVIQSLAGYVMECWSAAKRAKDPIERQMLQALRARKGEYEPDKLEEIRKTGAGSTVYMMLTDEKCNAAEAWLEDILLSADDKPWTVKPTPVPDLPVWKQRQVVAEAQERMKAELASDAQLGVNINPEEIRRRMQELVSEIQERMVQEARKADAWLENQLEDALIESNWDVALREVISDIVTYPAGIIKGPFFVREPELFMGPAGPRVIKVLKKKFKRVDPFNIYPSPSSKGINDGYLIEKHTFTRSDLASLIGVPGYDDQAIRRVLSEYGKGGLRSWLWGVDQEKARAQGRDQEQNDPEGKIDALQFWGSVQGRMLIEYGMDESQVPDPEAEYPVEVWLIGNWVIKAELNGDPLGRKPYFKASFRERNDQFWGYDVPYLIQDVQDVCNASARNIVNNMAIASGPQVGIDVGQLAPGEDPTDMFPWRIWQFDVTNNNTARQPIAFFQPPSVVQELMRVYEFFSNEADNKTGIPKYAYGSKQNMGALSTATGFSMMMSNAARGIKKVMGNIDRGIIAPSVHRMYQFMLLHDPKFARMYGGDRKIVAKGAGSLLAKEQQQVRRNEFLNICLSSPIAQEIMGIPGVAEVLREVVKGLEIGVEHVIPTRDELLRKQHRIEAMREAMARMQAGQAANGRGQALQPPQGFKGAISMPKPVGVMPDGSRAGGQDMKVFQ